MGKILNTILAGTFALVGLSSGLYAQSESKSRPIKDMGSFLAMLDNHPKKTCLDNASFMFSRQYYHLFCDHFFRDGGEAYSEPDVDFESEMIEFDTYCKQFKEAYYDCHSHNESMTDENKYPYGEKFGYDLYDNVPLSEGNGSILDFRDGVGFRYKTCGDEVLVYDRNNTGLGADRIVILGNQESVTEIDRAYAMDNAKDISSSRLGYLVNTWYDRYDQDETPMSPLTKKIIDLDEGKVYNFKDGENGTITSMTQLEKDIVNTQYTQLLQQAARSLQ